MSEIQIELNKDEFTGGDTIAGEVVVNVNQDMPFRGIRLLLQGYEQSSWREGSGKHRHTHSETRNFFDEEITLQGRPRLSAGELLVDSVKGVFSKEGYEVLRAGAYRYPFTFVLPPDLPGNYESSVTNSVIYYGVKAKVDLPLKVDLEAEETLSIREPVDPSAVRPVTEHQTKKFLFDSDSLVEAEVHLEKDTFSLGETLHCRLEVTNRAANKEIRAVTLALRQMETAHADGRTHEAEKEITRERFAEHQFSFQQCAKVDLELPIPEDLYPTVEHAHLVKLDYKLQVVLDIPWAVDAKLSVPIRLVRAVEQAAL